MLKLPSRLVKQRLSWLPSSFVFGFLFLTLVLGDTRPAVAIPAPSLHVRAIPAFARKYGMPCSACHEAWPKLNNFGQTFKDNGYQMMNDRDAPIFQQAAYWPVAFRITPNWHRESVNRTDIFNPATGSTAEGQLTTHGFDLSGMDILAAGTLAKNISFLLVPSADNTGAFHFESANVRFDNLLHSSWLNVKVGKFELDNIISEKRILTLSNNGGLYQIYHFVPVGDINGFGLGDNQLGAELSGHSKNDYTRYSVALLSSNDGNVGLSNGHGYDTYLTFSQAFEAGSLGLQRVGSVVHQEARFHDHVHARGGRRLPRHRHASLRRSPSRSAGASLEWWHDRDSLHTQSAVRSYQPLRIDPHVASSSCDQPRQPRRH